MKFYVTALSLLVFCVFSNRLIQASATCPPGTFVNGTSCVGCPAGTYRSEEDSPTECIKCDGGYYNPFPGAQVSDFCQQCPEDTFSLPGSGSCTPCAPGTISDRASTVCLACGPGTSLLHDRCEKCYKGTFSTGSANRECESCPWHYTTDIRGATSASACRPLPCIVKGFACENCEGGMYYDFSRGGCYFCPRGTFSNTKGPTKCIECPKGSIAKYEWSSKCEKCQKGYIAPNRGESVCKKKGFPCPSNHFRDYKGRCKQCLINERLDTKTLRCTACPEGQYSLGGNIQKCKACPQGFVYSERLADCVCPAGSVQTKNGPCKKCPPGTYRDSPENGPICDSCYPGSFAASTGSVECTLCPAGTYQPEKGKTKCIPCPPGTFQKPFYSNECVSTKTFCPPGYERRNVYGSKCIPRSCPEGTFGVQGSYGLECKTCFRGQRFIEKTKTCVSCEENEVSPGGLVKKCTKCPKGMFQYKPEGDLCKCISSGYGWQNGKCKKCPKGTYNSYYKDTCTKCPPGTFSNRRGSYGCRTCRAGTVSKSGAAKCTRCPPGSITYGLGESRCVFPF